MILNLTHAYQSFNKETMQMAKELYDGAPNLKETSENESLLATFQDSARRNQCIKILSKVIQVAFAVIVGLTIYVALASPAVSLTLGAVGFGLGMTINPARVGKLLTSMDELTERRPIIALALAGVAIVFAGSFIFSAVAGGLVRRIVLVSQ